MVTKAAEAAAQLVQIRRDESDCTTLETENRPLSPLRRAGYE